MNEEDESRTVNAVCVSLSLCWKVIGPCGAANSHFSSFKWDFQPPPYLTRCSVTGYSMSGQKCRLCVGIQVRGNCPYTILTLMDRLHLAAKANVNQRILLAELFEPSLEDLLRYALPGLQWHCSVVRSRDEFPVCVNPWVVPLSDGRLLTKTTRHKDRVRDVRWNTWAYLSMILSSLGMPSLTSFAQTFCQAQLSE